MLISRGSRWYNEEATGSRRDTESDRLILSSDSSKWCPRASRGKSVRSIGKRIWVIPPVLGGASINKSC